MRLLRSAFVIGSVATLLQFAPSAYAQPAKYIGAAITCTKSGCHQDQKKWSELEEQAPNRHKDAFDQLTRDPEKAMKYAMSIGVPDPQSPTGRCVECHAPRNARFFKEGVSCEVCHGAGSRYEVPHDDQPYMTVGYVKAQGLGMPAFINNPTAWVQRCVSCHVVAEAPLVAAGHPSGKDFEVSVKYKIVSSLNGNHWKTKYDARLNEIKALDKQFGDPVRNSTASPSAAPRITMNIPAPPVPTPPPTALPPTAIAPAASLGGTPATTSVAGSGTPPPPPTTMSRREGGGPPPIRDRLLPIPALPPVSLTPVASSATTASVPPDVPLPGVTVAGLPRSPAALVAAVQGRAIELLNSLLTRNAVVPMRVRPADLTIEYNGPDAELLRLQRETLALALDALGTAPNPPRSPKP